MKLIITRKYKLKQTEGDLEIYDKDKFVFNCKSLELPWKNNKRNISCIPEGEYILKKIIRPNKDIAIKLFNTAPRTNILIHKGNYVTDIKGCILVGVGFYDINKDGLKDVTYSSLTLKNIYNLLPDNEQNTLTIKS